MVTFDLNLRFKTDSFLFYSCQTAEDVEEEEELQFQEAAEGNAREVKQAPGKPMKQLRRGEQKLRGGSERKFWIKIFRIFKDL